MQFHPGGMRVSDEPKQAKSEGGTVQRLRLSPTKAQVAQQGKGGPEAPAKTPLAGDGPKPPAPVAGQGTAQAQNGAGLQQPAAHVPTAKNPNAPAVNTPTSAPANPTPQKPGPNAQIPNTPVPPGGGGNAPPLAGPKTDVAAYQPVSPARVKLRHRGIIFSFLLLVLLPMAVMGWYLWARAADQYASTVGFSVRTEEVGSAIEILGGITELSGSSSSDTDILYEFLQSQKLVRDIDTQLDLRGIWSKPENDPFFSYDTTGTIEDLLAHWKRKVNVFYDTGTGLMELRVLAFDPDDAHAISEAVFAASSSMINELNAIAREDAIRYAREELENAVERLRQARQVLTQFRNRNQIVDPTVDLQSQAGLLGSLEAELANSLIELDLLKQTSRAGDPRIVQAERRVQVIEERIDAERKKLGFGSGTDDGDFLANLVGDFERLVVDREFAETAYVSALAAFDASQAEARRQSRYLAAHVLPTLAERAEYPERELLLGLLGLFLLLGWAIIVMVYYALRDRR